MKAVLWTRSPEGGWLAGICSGLSQSFDIEAWILRAAFLIGFFCFGLGGLLYILLAICLPKKNNIEASYRRRVLGVCKNLALKYDLEVGLVRLAMCFLALSSFGASILAYVIIYFVMPKDSENYG